MTSQKVYGGDWTQDKLDRLKGYLEAYMQILKEYPFFQTVYVDAFAGTGQRKSRRRTSGPEPETLGTAEPEVQGFMKGSTRVALDVRPMFNRYIFIERSAKKCQELATLKEEYPEQADRIQIEQSDAATYLMNWLKQTDWSRTRAVMFLDPFGMQVEWSLLEAIGATKAIDLWLLVPIGMGVNRLLTQNDLPPEDWSAKLTRFFGTDEWQQKFYRPKQQPGLFDEGTEQEKGADHESIKAYFVDRLQGIFEKVAPNPLTQRNSKNSPLFLLCFAAGNKKGAPTAIKIAQHLLKE